MPSKYSLKQPSPRRLENLDKKFIWHPFTQMQEWQNEQPIIIKSGRGCLLTDIHNKKYIDGISSLWVTIHGHRKKEIDQAVSRQLKMVAHSTLLGLSNVPAVLLAEKLMRIAPPKLSKVFYSDSGSTAVEIALKLAFQYWQQKGPKFGTKTKFISLKQAYQGKIASVSWELQRFKELKHVGEVRQRGFMVGIELVQDRLTKKPHPLENKIGIRVIMECRKNGLIIRPLGNVIVLIPPLSISIRELKRMTRIVFKGIQHVTSSS